MVVNDVLTLAAGTRRRARGPPARDAGPPLLSALCAGAAAVRARRAAAAHADSAAPPGGCSHARSDAGVERGRRELNETRRRVGLPPLAHPHGGISDELCLVATFPQLEYPRGLAGRRARHRPAAVGAAAATSSCRRATSRSCWSRRAPPRTRASGCCARRSRASRACPCGCSPPHNRRAAAGRPLPSPAERAPGRVGVVLADDAACRRRHLPRRPRHPGARAGERRAGRDRSRRGRHGENAARQWSRRGSRPAEPLPRRPRRCAGRCAGCSRTARTGPARGRSPSGRSATTGRHGLPAAQGIRRLRAPNGDSGYTRPLRTLLRRGQGPGLWPGGLWDRMQHRCARHCRVHLHLRRDRGDGRCRPRGGRSDLPHRAGLLRPRPDATPAGSGDIEQRRNDDRLHPQRRLELPRPGPLPRPGRQSRAGRHALGSGGDRLPAPPSPSTPRAMRSPSGRATPAPT